MQTRNIENFFSTETTALIDNSSSVLNVLSNTGSPNVPFVVLVGQEKMLVTNKGGGLNWSVTRGFEGTTATSHLSGSIVSNIIDAELLESAKSRHVVAYDLAANQEVAANSSHRIFVPSDLPIMMVNDNGWVSIPSLEKHNIVSQVGSWTWDFQGDPAVTLITNDNAVSIDYPRACDAAYFGKAPASSSFEIVSSIIPYLDTNSSNTNGCGIYVGSTSLNSSYILCARSSGAGHQWGVVTTNRLNTVPTSISSKVSSLVHVYSPFVYLKIIVNSGSTSGTFQMSTDGITWYQLFSETAAFFGSVNRCGIAVWHNYTLTGFQLNGFCTWLSWKETAL